MKKSFEIPKINIVLFMHENVIVASGIKAVDNVNLNPQDGTKLAEIFTFDGK